jgi:hypothetical protein
MRRPTSRTGGWRLPGWWPTTWSSATPLSRSTVRDSGETTRRSSAQRVRSYRAGAACADVPADAAHPQHDTPRGPMGLCNTGLAAFVHAQTAAALDMQGAGRSCPTPGWRCPTTGVSSVTPSAEQLKKPAAFHYSLRVHKSCPRGLSPSACEAARSSCSYHRLQACRVDGVQRHPPERPHPAVVPRLQAAQPGPRQLGLASKASAAQPAASRCVCDVEGLLYAGMRLATLTLYT